MNEQITEALEMCRSLLRNIERRAPGTKGFVDYDAFIMNELNPALVAARSETAQWVSVNDRLPPLGTDCECRGVFDNIWRVTHWRTR